MSWRTGTAIRSTSMRSRRAVSRSPSRTSTRFTDGNSLAEAISEATDCLGGLSPVELYDVTTFRRLARPRDAQQPFPAQFWPPGRPFARHCVRNGCQPTLSPLSWESNNARCFECSVPATPRKSAYWRKRLPSSAHGWWFPWRKPPDLTTPASPRKKDRKASREARARGIG